MSGAGILEAGVVVGSAAIRGAILAAEGAVLGAAAAAWQWHEESGRLRACREADILRQLMLAEVTARNARIAALRDLCAEAGAEAAPQLPAPLDVGLAGIAELVAWCERTDSALEAADAVVSRRLAAGMVAAMAARHSDRGIASRLVRAADELTRRDALVEPTQRADVEQVLVRVLARLTADASAEDRRSVGDAADRVLGAPTDGEARICLDEVRVRVQRANERPRTRRAAIVDAARMLHVVGTGAGAARIRAELTEVVQGRRPLDDDLRARAAEQVAAADAKADHRYLADTVVATLADLGYVVDEGFETATAEDGVLRIRSGDHAEHAVHLHIDPKSKQIRAALVRTAAGATEAAERAADAASERAWCATLETAMERLEEVGVQASVKDLTPVGSRPVPRIAQAGGPAARRAKARGAPRRRP